MLKEQIKMSNEQVQQISNMLKKQGLTESEIDKIINGEYSSFQTDFDLTQTFSSNGDYQNVLRGLADGYFIDELQQQGITQKEIDEFMQELEKCNLTIDNAKAINQYSNGSNMILSIKRGTADKSAIQNGIITDMISKLQIRGLSQEQISRLDNYIRTLDFSKPVHENYEMIKQYMEKKNIPSICYPSLSTAVKGMDSLEHIDSTLASLDDVLSKSRLPQSMILYRAIRTNKNINLESYVGKNISNNGFTSTSPLYNSSFAKYNDYDTVIQIYAPKGTQGSYITKLSDYEKIEQEVLLNPNDIYVIEAQKGVIDQNGKIKTVLKGLLLSKERECYRGIDKQEETIRTNNSQQQYKDTITSEKEEVTPPANQNRISRFFSQIRARFFRRNDNYTNSTDNTLYNSYTDIVDSCPKNKKSWELDPEEQARKQKKAAQIAQKHREQEEQKLAQNQQQSIDIGDI